MIWNPDFEIAALLLTLTFNVFYVRQRRLPLYQNHLFSRILRTEFGVILSDLIASYVSSYGERYPVALQYFINTVYFALFAFLIENFYLFTMSLTGTAGRLTKTWRYVLRIPFLLIEIFIISSFFTGMIFRIDTHGGYQRGWGYLTIIGFVCFYVLLSLVFILVCRKNVAFWQLVSICVFSIIELSGVFLQVFLFPYVLLTNGCSALAIAIIYLSLQNPDFYINNMTGLFNTDAFMEITSEKIERNEAFSCLGIIIDKYGIARKIYGKDQLDSCMGMIAAFLKKDTPDAMTFYFHDGSFVMMGTDSDELEKKGAEIRQRFAHSWKVVKGEIFFSVSMAVWPEEVKKENAAEVMDVLQLAMDEAAADSNDHCIKVDKNLLDRMKRDVKVESTLSKAIDSNSIEVYFQPIYSNMQKKITAAEALARLYDPELGFIPPDEFIPKAEQNGSIIQLGKQVFEKTCTFINESNLCEMNIEYVEINLSPIQCLRERLADDLMSIAHKHGVHMNQVNLEITETATMDEDMIRKNMCQLMKSGTTFSLDDYGTGFSNLINILNLPLRIVKIDKSIVWSYFNDSRDVLPHVIKMFKSQQLEIVAEGVETQKMAEELAEMGCDYEQGFYFSKPVPREEFLEYVRKVNSE